MEDQDDRKGIYRRLIGSPSRRDAERSRARARTAEHPYLSGDVRSKTLPFAIATIGAIALLPFATEGGIDGPAVSVAAAIFMAETLVVYLAPWKQLPTWVRVLPPLSFLLVVAALREAAGGADSGYAPLALVVPVWLGLYEGRKSVAAAVIGVAIVLIAPIVIVGPPEYSSEQLRQAIILIGIAAFIGGTVQGIVQQVRDREGENLRSQQFLLAVMNAAAEGIVTLDGRGRIVFANPGALAMLGYSSEQVTGRSFHELVHHTRPDGSHYPERECPIHRTLRSGTQQEISNDLFWRRNGSSFPVAYDSTELRDPNADERGVVVTFVDNTERRRVEEVKDELLSVVGHELRTPLTSIRGSLGLIAGGAAGEIPPEAERMIAIAVTNTDRLVRLINDILDIERIESGRVQLSRKLCEVEQLIEQSLATLQAQADRAHVLLEGRPVTATLWADPDRILQALMNLISNAIKFSPEGGAVTVAAFREPAEVRFEIRDRGRGIPADKLESVFERFAQVDASDSREKGGTGLGLPISRSIVHQHNGRIWIESEFGEGTTISFTVPALPAETEEVDPGRDDGRPFVLLVEDDADLAGVLEAMFASDGLAVRKASRVTEAVRMLVQAVPALVVLDLSLPDGDGAELVRWMHKQPELARLPLAVYTDADLTDEDREGLQLGPSIHYTKSRITPEEFGSRARTLLDGVAEADADKEEIR